MKKLLAIIMGILCFCNVVIFTACDGSGNSTSNSAASPSGSTASASSDSPSDSATPNSSTPDSTTFENANGGGNVSTPVSKVIKYVESDSISLWESKPIQITNVPETTVKFDTSKVSDDLINPENDNYKFGGLAYETTNINEIYAVFDKLYKESIYVPGTGLLFLPDLTGVEGLSITYEFFLGQSNLSENGKIGNNVFDRDDIRYRPWAQVWITGEIEIEDGRTYKFEMSYENAYCLYNSEAHQYIINDGNALFTDMTLRSEVGMGGATKVMFSLSYLSSNPDNVYMGGNPTTFGHFYIYLDDEDSLTEEEIDKVAGQFYNLLKDKIMVYNYDYYQHQFDEVKA